MMGNAVRISLHEQIEIALGPVSGLIRDPEVTDIFIYGRNKVFVKKFGQGLSRVPCGWEEDIDLVVACNTIAQLLKKKLNFDFPVLDGRLSDGSRINIVTSPVFAGGACVSIRKFPEKKLTFDDYIKLGTIDETGIRILQMIVEHGMKLIVSGGTGTGKTTLLNLLCGFISEGEIIVTVEDSRELDLAHDFWAPLEVKNAYYQNDTSVSLRDLVKNSLRMFPKWIILGEVRSGEVFDLIRAFNSGHSGMSSLHADSCEDALFALENMFLQGMEMRIEAVRQAIGRAVDVIVQITRFRDNRIRITDISEITGVEYRNGMPGYRMNSLYMFEPGEFDESGKISGEFVLKNPPEFIKSDKFLPPSLIPPFWQE
jgi:pilus assembly protein CpaF